MEDRDIEIERLKKELASLKRDPRELILASRIREREEEYQHRLLELELASEGIIPVGIAPEAKAHGGKEFTALMKEVEDEEILQLAQRGAYLMSAAGADSISGVVTGPPPPPSRRLARSTKGG